MAAGKLQDSLSPERMFQGLLAHRALASDEGSFASGPRALQLEHSRHRATGSPVEGRLHRIAVDRPRELWHGRPGPQRRLLRVRLVCLEAIDGELDRPTVSGNGDGPVGDATHEGGVRRRWVGRIRFASRAVCSRIRGRGMA